MMLTYLLIGLIVTVHMWLRFGPLLDVLLTSEADYDEEDMPALRGIMAVLMVLLWPLFLPALGEHP